jgi:hypothetical protein
VKVPEEVPLDPPTPTPAPSSLLARAELAGRVEVNNIHLRGLVYAQALCLIISPSQTIFVNK